MVPGAPRTGWQWNCLLHRRDLGFCISFHGVGTGVLSDMSVGGPSCPYFLEIVVGLLFKAGIAYYQPDRQVLSSIALQSVGLQAVWATAVGLYETLCLRLSEFCLHLAFSASASACHKVVLQWSGLQHPNLPEKSCTICWNRDVQSNRLEWQVEPSIISNNIGPSQGSHLMFAGCCDSLPSAHTPLAGLLLMGFGGGRFSSLSRL